MSQGEKTAEGDEYNHLFKIVLVGDAGVGKTHLLNRYVKGELPKNTVPTIGVEFATKTVTLPGSQKVKTQIWDTAGQERYRSITSAHYRRAVGALLVYDITKEKTFDSVQKWMEDLKYQAEPDIVIMLVGNKLDLVDKNQVQRKVSREEAQTFAAENKLLFEETSAITSYKVNDVFEQLLQKILQVKSTTNEGNDQTFKVGDDQLNQEGGTSKQESQQQTCAC